MIALVGRGPRAPFWGCFLAARGGRRGRRRTCGGPRPSIEGCVPPTQQPEPGCLRDCSSSLRDCVICWVLQVKRYDQNLADTKRQAEEQQREVQK